MSTVLYKGLSGLIKGRKITVFEGTGQLQADLSVNVLDGADAGVVAKGKNVILAAGSVPRTLPGFEVDGKIVVTSDEFLDLTALPATATVIGGGAIGCEFASLLSDMGTKVTVLEGLPSILSGCDSEVANVVQRSFKKRGIEIRVRCQDHRPHAEEEQTSIAIEGEESVETELVVMSVGRRPRTEGLLAEGTNVVIDERGFVVADGAQRTANPNVFAVGDVVANTPQLAHVGFAEAIVAIKTILGEPAIPVDYDRVPWAIYSTRKWPSVV